MTKLMRHRKRIPTERFGEKRYGGLRSPVFEQHRKSPSHFSEKYRFLMSHLVTMLLLFVFLLFEELFCTLDLKKVVVVTRHGARSPVFDPIVESYQWECAPPNRVSKSPLSSTIPNPRVFYQNNAPIESIPGNCFAGELTKNGMLMHYHLGQDLNQEYVHGMKFLSETYSSDEVYLESTDHDRTIQSMESLMLGLFPKAASPSEVANFVCQELAKHDMYVVWYGKILPCPIVQHIFNEVVNSSAYLQWHNSTYGLRKEVAEILGKPLSSIDLFPIHDSLTCLKADHGPLPAGLNLSVANAIEETVCFEYYHFFFGNRDFVRLGIGHFVGRIVESLTSGSSPQKFYLFSGHDTTVMPLSVVLGLNLTKWAPYAANIIFELYDNPSTPSGQSVRVKYMGKEQVLNNLGCHSVDCDSKVFFNAVGEWIPKNWQQECQWSGNVEPRSRAFPPV